jgi:Rieske Fe-S protein
VLVRLQDEEFVAYSAVCTHQQCIGAYQPETQKLACPCHGGVYDPARGAAVEAGPPPAPLPEAEIEVRDGQVFKV